MELKEIRLQQGLTQEEAAKISMTIEIYTFEINLLDNIINLIEGFNPKEKN